MTVTVKLDALLEEQLRQRASAQGATTSEVIRQALIAYLREPVDASEPERRGVTGSRLGGKALDHETGREGCSCGQAGRGGLAL